MTQHRFAQALSTSASSAQAERDVLAALERDLGGATPDLALLFATHHHGSALEELGQRISAALRTHLLIGCTGESVIGGGREVEREPGLSVFAARLPNTSVELLEIDATPGPGEEVLFSAFPETRDASRAALILLAEPYSFPADVFLRELNQRLPGLTCVGGLASGGSGPGQNLLFTHKGLREGGAVGVLMEGATEVVSVVSQGCRPVGSPQVVTACDQHLIQKLGGRPAVEVLEETWRSLSPEDQRLMQRAPFLGLAVDATKSRFARSDFVARGIVGLHNEQKGIVLSDVVRRGQTVQFLVRDAASAGEDLRELVRAASAQNPAGALLFTCNGRGSRMFKQRDHDIGCVRAELGAELPVAGFFAAGEIGAVGGRNFLHGFTASVALLRARA